MPDSTPNFWVIGSSFCLWSLELPPSILALPVSEDFTLRNPTSFTYFLSQEPILASYWLSVCVQFLFQAFEVLYDLVWPALSLVLGKTVKNLGIGMVLSSTLSANSWDSGTKKKQRASTLAIAFWATIHHMLTGNSCLVMRGLYLLSMGGMYLPRGWWGRGSKSWDHARNIAKV